MCALVPCACAHARRRCGASAALPGSIRTPSCPNSGRVGGSRMVTHSEARAGWMPMDGGDLVVSVSSPPPPSLLPLYLSLSLATCASFPPSFPFLPPSPPLSPLPGEGGRGKKLDKIRWSRLKKSFQIKSCLFRHF
jgi:hypothetical protein